jgi:Uma2 family endonuclease
MESNGTSALKPGGRYTLADYRSWPEDERWELIYGIAYSMSPAPRLKHQRLLGGIFNQLANQLKGKPCEPFIAPVDLYPFPDGTAEEKETVVQPDLMIVCDPGKCREEGIFGAPDWILEVLSPSTAYKDQTEKKKLYQKCGVAEYWTLNPETLDLMIYRLEGELYAPPVGTRLDRAVELSVLPGIRLDGRDVAVEQP